MTFTITKKNHSVHGMMIILVLKTFKINQMDSLKLKIFKQVRITASLFFIY